MAACGGDTAEWETRWRAAAAELDLGSRRTRPVVLDGHQGPVRAMAFSPAAPTSSAWAIQLRDLTGRGEPTVLHGRRVLASANRHLTRGLTERELHKGS